MALLDRMLAQMGQTRQDFARNSKLGRVFRRRGVSHSSEVDRVVNIVRRRWQDAEDLERFTADTTEFLSHNGGTMQLRPVQAVALGELHDFGGLFAPIRVGGGKTLISFLAGTVTGARRPLLLIPAKLAKKTHTTFAELRHHWLGHPRLEIMSYELLSRDRGGRVFEQFEPDLIIADEAHKLKNPRAGCTRKVRRYMREHPDTKMVAMSGTITTRSLREYAHILAWCTRDHTPLPRSWGELSDWADCLDERVDELRRLAPGALLLFCSDAELATGQRGGMSTITLARRGYRRRLVETPGVVATEEAALGTSIQITEQRIENSEAVQTAFEHLRTQWETPDGHPCMEAVDIWRHARELACGFYYRWDPPAPPDWLEARKAWARFVRETLAGHRRGIDTEFQVASACKRGQLDDRAYLDWTAVRDDFKPNNVPVWIDDGMLRAAAAWLQQRDPPGLCWVEHRAFGQRLAEHTGFPYFTSGRGSECGLTLCEEDREPRAGEYAGPAIVSIASNSEGRNLQWHWSRNFVSSAPPNGMVWEQLLGRTHRDGQRADEVECVMAMACREQWAGFEQSRADARYIQDTTGQPQKLCYADMTMPREHEILARGHTDPAWGESNSVGPRL
jgi:hypothetical protein